jgi:SAM-dependent methyltransferase
MTTDPRNGNERRWLEKNVAMWNARLPLHVNSAWYDLDGFRKGVIILDDIEQAGLGDVEGKSLLHLQCHFGLGTLSCARLGADVTGVDFSHEAIMAARTLAAECGLGASFVEAEVSSLDLGMEFDVCFSSWGVLMWLPDLANWAEAVRRHLRPGGRFFLAEGHPHLFIWDDELGRDGYRPRNPYFRHEEPVADEEASTYVDTSVRLGMPQFRWNHPLCEVVTELAQHGLRIQDLTEYPRIPWQPLPWMVPADQPGFWRVDGDPFPLSFSVIAEKEVY